MDDEGLLSLGNVVLVCLGFPWAVLLVLDQVGLLEALLRAVGV